MKFIFATLHVKNLEESIRFYETVTGMKLARRFPAGPRTEIAFMADGPAEIELICSADARAVPIWRMPVAGAFRGKSGRGAGIHERTGSGNCPRTGSAESRYPLFLYS